MNETEELTKYAETLNQDLYEAQIKNKRLQTEYDSQSFGNKKDTATIVYQLDVTEDLSRAEHLLKGDELIKGNWIPTTDPNRKVFTRLGVQEIMNHALYPHLSKRILLGNLEPEQVDEKMRLFYRFLTDFIINRAEDFFEYPKTEEVYNRLKSLTKGDQSFNNISDDELYEQARIISRNELQNKINHLPMIIQHITNIVHSAYSSSIKGITFKEMMRNTHVSEVTSTSGIMGGQTPQRFNPLKPKTW